ncbi:MAG: 2-hydroxyacid dehydrogenase [Acidobacteriota bacterium]
MASGRLPLVVLTAPLPGDALTLAEGRARVRVVKVAAGDEEAMVRHLRNAHGAVVLLSHPVTERVLEACPNLKVVSNYAVGLDNVDLAAARRRGVRVTYTPDVLTEATADLTWALLLAVARRVVEGDRLVRRRRFRGWAPSLCLGMDLGGKTLGIVGMGRIGKAVARRALAFGMGVLYHNRTPLLPSEEAALGARFEELDRLLALSDVVSLHCPLTPETRHLLSAQRLRAMKEGAILINTARGPVVDEAALVQLLREGRLLGAGLDVYEREPALTPGLAALPNVVLLPHIGSAGRETRETMARMALGDCLKVLQGLEPDHPAV